MSASFPKPTLNNLYATHLYFTIYHFDQFQITSHQKQAIIRYVQYSLYSNSHVNRFIDGKVPRLPPTPLHVIRVMLMKICDGIRLTRLILLVKTSWIVRCLPSNASNNNTNNPIYVLSNLMYIHTYVRQLRAKFIIWIWFGIFGKLIWTSR